MGAVVLVGMGHVAPVGSAGLVWLSVWRGHRPSESLATLPGLFPPYF